MLNHILIREEGSVTPDTNIEQSCVGWLLLITKLIVGTLTEDIV